MNEMIVDFYEVYKTQYHIHRPIINKYPDEDIRDPKEII